MLSFSSSSPLMCIGKQQKMAKDVHAWFPCGESEFLISGFHLAWPCPCCCGYLESELSGGILCVCVCVHIFMSIFNSLLNKQKTLKINKRKSQNVLLLPFQPTSSYKCVLFPHLQRPLWLEFWIIKALWFSGSHH